MSVNALETWSVKQSTSCRCTETSRRRIKIEPLLPARGRPQVVLSTSIAETSLTVAGIRVVIDSGWARVSSFFTPNGDDAPGDRAGIQGFGGPAAGEGGTFGTGSLLPALDPRGGGVLRPVPPPRDLGGGLGDARPGTGAVGRFRPL